MYGYGYCLNAYVRFQKKCDHYWPEDNVQTYHGINVELLNTSDLPDFTTRTFKLTKVGRLITTIYEFSFVPISPCGFPFYIGCLYKCNYYNSEWPHIKTLNLRFCNYLHYAIHILAASSEFVSSSIPSWQILTVHSQPFSGARDLAFCLTVPLDSLLVWASSGGSGKTARMRRLAWTFAARIGDKYQIRLTRSILFPAHKTDSHTCLITGRWISDCKAISLYFVARPRSS